MAEKAPPTTATNHVDDITFEQNFKLVDKFHILRILRK